MYNKKEEVELYWLVFEIQSFSLYRLIRFSAFERIVRLLEWI
jgi:hypothetical protein